MPDNSVVGRYELVERISVGGMGTVWRGYDAVLDRPVAVKLIRPDRLVEPGQAEDFARRFRREARVTARIGHHGVPQVYDAVLAPPCDRVYLVMELIRGTDLRTYITTGVPLPVTWAVAIAAQIATVLSYAHAVPVVHRDLKPENVLITPDGALKVLDFGIAAILGTGTTKITATGHPVGTSRYMSPEQIRGAQVTPQSDLYALGCVLYELLCGRSVFDGRPTTSCGSSTSPPRRRPFQLPASDGRSSTPGSAEGGQGEPLVLGDPDFDLQFADEVSFFLSLRYPRLGGRCG
jgi:serine/threonine protein kinase